MSTQNCYSSKETWVAAILKIFNGPESEIEESILALYTPDVALTVNGSSMKMADFKEMVKNIRGIAVSVDITSHYFLRDGNLFADKHTVIGTGHDESKTQVEVLVIGELNDEGKCIWIEERSGTVSHG